MTVAKILDGLEAHYGKQQAGWPDDPYLFLIWWHCGYPASDEACAKGWASLLAAVGPRPEKLLAAPLAKLTQALAAGGMVPDSRAERLKEVASRVQEEFGGELRAALTGPISRARKLLKSFPGIADPGADRILLFGGIDPIAAVPSNCPQVLVRIRNGKEHPNYNTNYKAAQRMIDEELPQDFTARTRAYLLLKRHGQELCKRTSPICDSCPLRLACAYRP